MNLSNRLEQYDRISLLRADIIKLRNTLHQKQSEQENLQPMEKDFIVNCKMFADDVSGRWIRLSYKVDTYLVLDKYHNIETGNLDSYMFCQTCEIPTSEHMFDYSAKIVLSGMMLYGFGETSGNMQATPVIRYEDKCFFSPGSIVHNPTDGTYLILPSRDEHSSNVDMSHIPYVKILTGDELQKVKEYISSTFKAMLGGSDEPVAHE